MRYLVTLSIYSSEKMIKFEEKKAGDTVVCFVRFPRDLNASVNGLRCEIFERDAALTLFEVQNLNKGLPTRFFERPLDRTQPGFSGRERNSKAALRSTGSLACTARARAFTFSGVHFISFQGSSNCRDRPEDTPPSGQTNTYLYRSCSPFAPGKLSRIATLCQVWNRQ